MTRTEDRPKNKGKNILFANVENAGNSQMAEAFAISMGLIARSAGTKPAQNIYPTVIGAMRERGIDVSKSKPKFLTPEMLAQAELVIMIGLSIDQLCPRPMIPTLMKKLLDWSSLIDDPKGKSISEVRKIRDEVEKKIKQLAES